MSIEELNEQIRTVAKDVSLNLSSIIADETLPPQTKYGVLLAAAVATRNPKVIAAMNSAAAVVLTPIALATARSIAPVMTMKNLYSRFVHLTSNSEYKRMPARFRMDVFETSTVDSADVALWSLAVSVINGCGACMDAHEKALQEAWVSSQEIHAAVRYAAIVQSAAVAIEAAGSQLYASE